jgi:hypothetical protein
MTITPGNPGKVGIGTITPDSTLTVIGGARISKELQADSLLSRVLVGGTSSEDSLVIQSTGVSGTTGTTSGMVFKVGNNGETQAMTIRNNGNVGIGTTSPSNILHVSGSVSGTTGVNLNAQNLNSTGITRFRVTSNTGAFAMMAIGGSAYSGAAAYQDNALFSTDNTLYFLANHNTGTGGAGNINFTAGGFNNNPTMNIRPGNPGEVSVGGIADNGAYNLQCNGTGVWGAGAYQNGSDARIKENIAPLDSSLATVMQLKPVTFNYIPSFSKDQSTQPGFIAQDLQQALEGKNYINGVVSQGEQYMSVAYQTLIPLLTKAIQEQQAQIEALKKEIEQLKNK